MSNVNFSKDVYNMSGGADLKAQALQNKIASAEDNLKITGTRYYISSLRGSDTNDGKTPETPFLTFDRIKWMDFAEGDAVLLERGSLFRLPNGFYLRSGVSYGAYGTGPKPMVYGSYMNYAVPEIWVPHTAENVWKIAYFPHEDAGIVVFNDGEKTGEKFLTPDLLTKDFDFCHSWEDNAFYLYFSGGNPGSFFKSIEIGLRCILFNLDKGLRPDRNGRSACNVTIDNICFKYSGTFAIRGSADCKNIVISNCEIGWCGGSYHENRKNRFGNGIEFTAGCQNILVDSCWIYQMFDSAITFQIGGDNTVYKNIRFTNNLMEYCGMCGIEWWNSAIYTRPDYGTIENISFDNNISRFVGYGWVKGGIRCARHIQGPWELRNYPNLRNFVVKNNVFDCALGGLYKWWFSEEHTGYIMTDNEYYQKSTPKGIGAVWGNNETVYVNNAEEFESCVRLLDKKPKIVEWLE